MPDVPIIFKIFFVGFSVVFVIAFFGILGSFVYTIVKGRRLGRDRVGQLRRLSMDRGWAFNPDPDRSHSEQYPRLALFNLGENKRAINTITGSLVANGLRHQFRMGDHSYETSDMRDDSTTKHTLSYLIVHLPYAGVPELEIRPEHFVDRIGSALGFEDIDFESAEFSAKFHVRSSEKKFAYDILTPGTMEFLLASSRRSIEIKAGILCIMTDASTWEPEQFVLHLDWVAAFLNRWPSHVIQRLLQSTA